MPFYGKVLEKVAAGQAVTAAQLEQIRANFGLTERRTEDMHASTYEGVARNLLQPELDALTLQLGEIERVLK